MKSTSSVTVLMPAYNAEKTIAESISCILAQTYEDWELLIIDDGSTDRTKEICHSFARGESRIKLIELEHQGVCKASNHGLRIATTPLVARLDSDDICHPTRLEKQANFLADHPEVKVLGTWGQRINNSGKPLSRMYLGPLDLADYHAHLNRREPIFFIASSIMACRQTLLDFGGYGGFDGEDFPGEDVWLWTRVAQKHLVLTFPEELVGYRITHHGISNTKFVQQHEQTARLRYSLAQGRWVSVEEFRRICERDPMRRLGLLRDRLHRYWFRTGAGYFFNGRPILGASYLVASTLLNPMNVIHRTVHRS